MTFTYKLARRLAVAHVAPLALLGALAACGGDSTGPDAEPVATPGAMPGTMPDGTPGATPGASAGLAAVVLTPRTSAIKVNERIRFAAFGRSNAGDSLPVTVRWSATGGSIGPDGTFTAAASGDYRVIGTVPGSSLADTVPVSVRSAPTPASGTANYPNEPQGWTGLADRGFGSATEDGWSMTSWSRFKVASDASAPLSGPSVGRAVYPAGFAGGKEPVVVTKVLSGGHEQIYISFWMKLSPNFVGHPSSGVNKILHFWVNGINRVALSAQGRNHDALEPQVRLQQINGPDAFVNLRPNQGSGLRLERNTWYRWEVRLRTNTNGQANGVIEWWVNGVKLGSYTNVNFVPAGARRAWEQVQWGPTWGGMGDTVPADQWMDMDHIHVSGG
jgi:hypothetical protein